MGSGGIPPLVRGDELRDNPYRLSGRNLAERDGTEPKCTPMAASSVATTLRWRV